jgi:hypothetical protein
MRLRATAALLAALAVIQVAWAAGTAYRWVDPTTGAIVFSDTPPPEGWPVRDLERIELPQPRTVPAFRPPPAAPRPAPSARRAPAPARPPYERIWIAWPPHDESIRENAGNVTVQVGLEPPALRPGDAVVLYVDGLPTVRASRLEILLENMDRGTHTLQAAVVDPAGNTVIRSDPVTFTLHRYSRLFRRGPVTPVETQPAPRVGPPGKR